MQTFLPCPDFEQTAQVLDYRRLGRQRVEAYQILRTLSGISKGWSNHPAVRMWRGYELALCDYMNTMIREWVERGYKNRMFLVTLLDPYPYPPWLGEPEFHAAHRSNLLRKDPEHYRKYWPEDPADLDYVWPVP